MLAQSLTFLFATGFCIKSLFMSCVWFGPCTAAMIEQSSWFSHSKPTPPALQRHSGYQSKHNDHSQIESGTCPGFPSLQGRLCHSNGVAPKSAPVPWYGVIYDVLRFDVMWFNVRRCDLIQWYDFPTYVHMMHCSKTSFLLCRPHLVSTYPNRCVHAHKQDKSFLCPSTLAWKTMESP